MISIIVPIYKVEKYLHACVDSILASTYQDFELILVDDGSPDWCGTICDAYAQQDKRVMVIHKQNGGISDARNEGLKAANGEYIAFVDGDDTIHPRMLEVLYHAILSGDYDYSMVCARFVQEENTGNDEEEQNPREEPSKIVITQGEYMSNLGNLGFDAYNYHVVWNKLYKHALIKGILFKSIASEDVEWLSRACLKMNEGIFIEEPYYNYLQRSRSIMHTDVSARNMARIKTYHECLNNMPLNCPEYRAIMLKALYSMIFGNRYDNKRDNTRLKEINTQARAIYRETRAELLHSKLSLSRKIRILCLYHLPFLYELLCKLKYGSLKIA